MIVIDWFTRYLMDRQKSFNAKDIMMIKHKRNLYSRILINDINYADELR